MSIASLDLGRFTATIEPNEDRPGVNCYIEDNQTGEFCSLACAENELDPFDNGVRISTLVTDKIANWAYGYGY